MSPASELSESVPFNATLAPVSLPTIGDLSPSGTSVIVVFALRYSPFDDVTVVESSAFVSFTNTSSPPNSLNLNALPLPNFPRRTPAAVSSARSVAATVVTCLINF